MPTDRATSSRDEPGYWSCEMPALFALLHSNATGLSQAEARRRLLRQGENVPTPTDGTGPWRQFLRQFESPLVLILLFGAAMSMVVTEWTEAAIIVLIIAGSTMLGFTQEYRAARAVKGLRDRLALKVMALRDGKPALIDARQVVPGDVIMLAAGNLVPADGVVISARDFLVSEAALTGESFPVEKRPGLADADAPLAGRANSVFQGTSVRSGTATVLVARTGRATEFGGIAARLALADPETDFERGIRRFGVLLTRIMVVMVIFVFAANLLQHRPLVDSLLFSVALAVGLTPELLPAIVSVTLSAGARRMAGRGVIVRRLAAIENLGAIDVLCTDKTGTLTSGVVGLALAAGPDGSASERVFRFAAINARFEAGIVNALDTAIVTEADRRGIDLGPVTKIDEIPYDFLRKRLTVVVAEDQAASGTHLIVTKGAFDSVLACCSAMAAGSGATQPLDPVPLQEFYRRRGEEGFRVLGVATRRVPAKARYGREDEVDMVFEGFLLFQDPLKPGIEATLRELGELGIAVKIITGDNRHVAAHVAEAVGLDPSRLLTGEAINQTRDEALWHLAEITQVFAEIDPQQKERIVRALQRRGHAVAYMGDGINDAPALHTADVGVSVAQAVDVARDSADIVLLEQDLGVLKDGIVDGRRTFANTLKYVSITTSANFGNMLSMAAASLYLPFLPLLAKQILLNNFLSDLPSVALATDAVDPEIVAVAPRWDMRGIRSFMVVFGLVSSVFDITTFVVLLRVYHAPEAEFQTTWFIVSLLTELAVVLVLRTRRPSWKSRPRPVLVLSTLAVALAALSVPYLWDASTAFGFTALPWQLLVVALMIVAAYIAATEAVKVWFFSRGVARKRRGGS